MPKYVKCPRCELNYIPEDQEYCDVCKAELNIGGITLLEDEEELLCPKCKRNYLEPGEKICSSCASKLIIDDGDKNPTIFDDPDLASLAELQEEEWQEDENETFDDEDGFGNTADFVTETESLFDDDVFVDDIVDDTEYDDVDVEVEEELLDSTEEDDFDFLELDEEDFDSDEEFDDEDLSDDEDLLDEDIIDDEF